MRACIAGSFLALFLVGCGSDTPLPDLPPARADLPEAEPLSWFEDAAIEAAIRGRVAMGARSGFVVLVARDGRVVHATTTGDQDVEAGIPMSLDTRFQIASMTKPVIGTAAMILVDEGRLGLDEPVSSYLPSFTDLRVAITDEAGTVTGTKPMASPLLVRHVLAFASGMGPGFAPGPLRDRWLAEGTYAGSGPLSTRIERIPPLPFFEEPGTRWRYGAAYDVLARLIEVASGEPVDRFLERRIFAPLGMTRTTYLKDVPADAPLAVMYQLGEDGLVRAVQENRPDDWTPGGTGLVSTAADYMRFALMLWNEGEYDGVRILETATARRMREPEIGGVLAGEMGIEGLSFGLGVSVMTDAEASLLPGHDGDFWWSGAYGTHLWISPATGTVLVVMQQQQRDPTGGDDPIVPFLLQAIVVGG
ncbi:MAG: beta-lactamase family protein [bacterium]|nr:beta-lactamase family protein [bacterium]